MAEATAKDVMTMDITCISPDTSVRHAAAIMLARRVSGLPVIDNEGRLAGILTEGDLMRRTELRNAALAGSGSDATLEDRTEAYVQSHSWRAGDVMTTNVVSVPESATLSDIDTLYDRLII